MTNKLQARTVVKPMGDMRDEMKEEKGMIRIQTEFGVGFIVYSSEEDRQEAMRFLDSLGTKGSAVAKKEGK